MNVYVEEAMEKKVINKQKEKNWGRKTVNTLRFADVITVLAESEKKILKS